MEEIWKDIEGYEGHYQVSNFGRVRRWQRRNKKWYYLKLNISGNVKYYMVSLSKGSRHKKCLVHRIEMQAFVPNPLDLPCVNHKDENKTNNFIFVNPDGSVDLEKSNLEWCSVSYNNTYNDKMKCRKKAVLQLKDGVVVREYSSMTEAANNIGMAVSGICNVISGAAKSCGGYQWKYKDS